MVLNEQEKINANHFSEFKILVDKLAHKHNDFWLDNKLITHQNILRMADVTLVADLVIAMCEGIQSKKQIKAFYGKYEKTIYFDSDLIEAKFDETIGLLKGVFNEGLKKTPFKRIHLFYTVFTSFYHSMFNIKNLERESKAITKNRFELVKTTLSGLNEIFDVFPGPQITSAEAQFLEDSRRATTDTKVRIRRSQFIVDILNSL